MAKLTVVRRMSFDAAHWLPGHPKCGTCHGHRFVVELGVRGEVGEDGMVLDFAELKRFLDTVKETFDHGVVNDTVEVPTSENLCLYVKNRFLAPYGCELRFVRVWETEDSYAEWRNEEAQT